MKLAIFFTIHEIYAVFLNPSLICYVKPYSHNFVIMLNHTLTTIRQEGKNVVLRDGKEGCNFW
jgi:hypothetical protein